MGRTEGTHRMKSTMRVPAGPSMSIASSGSLPSGIGAARIASRAASAVRDRVIAEPPVPPPPPPPAEPEPEPTLVYPVTVAEEAVAEEEEGGRTPYAMPGACGTG